MSTTFLITETALNKILPNDKTGLPWEIWQMIFSWLPACDLCRVTCVCKNWKELVASVDTTHWKELYLSCRGWRHPFWPLNTQTEPPSWRLAYRDQHISYKFWRHRLKHETNQTSCSLLFNKPVLHKTISVGPGLEHETLKSAFAVATHYDQIRVHPGIYDEQFEIAPKVPFELIGHGELGSVILVVGIQQLAMTAHFNNLVLRAPWFTSFIVLINSGFLQIDNCILEDGMLCAQHPSTISIRFCTFRHATVILQNMNAGIIENCEFSQSDSANIIIEGHPKGEKNWTYPFLRDHTDAVFQQRRSLHRKRNALKATTSMTSTIHSSFTTKSLTTGHSTQIYDTISHDFDEPGASFLYPNLLSGRYLGSDREGMVGCGDLCSMYEEPETCEKNEAAPPSLSVDNKDCTNTKTVSKAANCHVKSTELSKSDEAVALNDSMSSFQKDMATGKINSSSKDSIDKSVTISKRRKSLGSCSLQLIDESPDASSDPHRHNLMNSREEFSLTKLAEVSTSGSSQVDWQEGQVVGMENKRRSSLKKNDSQRSIESKEKSQHENQNLVEETENHHHSSHVIDDKAFQSLSNSPIPNQNNTSSIDLNLNSHHIPSDISVDPSNDTNVNSNHPSHCSTVTAHVTPSSSDITGAASGSRPHPHHFENPMNHSPHCSYIEPRFPHPQRQQQNQQQQQHQLQQRPPLRRSQSDEIIQGSDHDSSSSSDSLDSSDEIDGQEGPNNDSMSSSTDSSDNCSINCSGSDGSLSSSEESVIMLPHLREFRVDHFSNSTSPRGIDAEILSINSSCTRPVPVNISEDTLMNNYVGQIQGCLIHQCRMNHSKGGVMITLQAQAIIHECEINNVGYGIRCIQNSKAVILKNKIHHCRTSGIFMRLGASGLIAGNDIHSNNEAGVDIRKNADPLVQYNQIHHGKRSGVAVLGSGRGQIKKNDIYGNTEAGIYVLYGGNPIISENYIYEGRAAGVAVNAYGKGSIVDNVIRGNQWGGVDIRNGGFPLVKGNSIINGLSDGIVVGISGKGCLENNNITGNAGCGIWAVSAKHLYIHGNQICCSGHAGIMLLDKTSGTFDTHLSEMSQTDDLNYDNYSPCDTDHFRTQWQLTTATLQYNNISHNRAHGILVEMKEEVHLAHNSIHENNGHGIIMSQDAPALVKGNSISNNSGSGLVTSDSNKINVCGNGIYDNAQHGLVCKNECVLEGNDVMGHPLASVQIEGKAVIKMTSNRLSSSKEPAVMGSEQSTVMAVKNSIFDNGGGDFACQGSFKSTETKLTRPTLLVKDSNKKLNQKETSERNEFLKDPPARPHAVPPPPPFTSVPLYQMAMVTKVALPSTESCDKGSKVCHVL